jgi:activator of HSP90 ATPase
MFRYVIALMMVLSCSANAHQFLPTYPKFQNSFVEGVVYTKMELFNKRKEIVFYELGVFDGDWNSITFATESKIIRVNYLETKYINVYIKKEDLKRAVYICTESKIRKEDIQATSIASKICSKIK